MTIKEQIDKLTKQQKEIGEKIASLRAICKHENAVGEYWGGFRNCDYDNSEWLEVKCPDCGYMKTYYSNEPGYARFKGKIKGR